MKFLTEINPEPISEIESVDLIGINPNSEINCEFVRIKDASTNKPIINLKIESDYSPASKQSSVANEIVIIGYGNRFLMFDLLIL